MKRRINKNYHATLFIIRDNLDEENMDWSRQNNYHRAHCEALDTPYLASV